MTSFATLAHPASSPGPVPSLIFMVNTWDAPKDKIPGAELTLFTCDYDAGSDTAPVTKTIAVISLDLVRNTAAEPKVGWIVATPKLKKGKSGKSFVLYLGGEAEKALTLTLALPGFDPDTRYDFTGDVPIGFTLKAGGAELTVNSRASTVVSTIAARDPLQTLLSLGKDKKTGRFSDPKRTPNFAPGDAFQQLETETLKLVRAVPPSLPIDVDGLRFTNFVKKERRRAVIQDLAADTTIVIAKTDPPAKDDNDFVKSVWKTTDIGMAYLFVHDIGNETHYVSAKNRTRVDSGGYTDGTYGPRSFNDRNTTRAFGSAHVVNGFINMNGTVALCKDMTVSQCGATKPWSLSPWASAYWLAYESFPVCLSDDDADSNSGTDSKKGSYNYTYVSVGWDPNAHVYVKWPTTLIETYANLYLLASARSNHLLTITTHNEAGHGEHDDPRGLDMQKLYDKITEKLNALSTKEGGSVQLPTGVRYGLSPARVLDPDLSDKDHKSRPLSISPHIKNYNFPHQSGTWKD